MVFDRCHVIHRDDGYHVKWTIPHDLPFVQGHFPGNPIVPAVTTIDATVACLREVANARFEAIASIDVAKFGSPLQPGMTVWIHVKRTGEKEWRAEWRMDGDEGKTVAELTLSVR